MIEQLTVLAPGLLGGSVARAARARGVARRIVLWARRPEARGALAAQPWCDAAAESLAEAARSADLVVIAAPVDQIIPLAREIAPHLPFGATVTDVGSVKGEIARQGDEALAGRAHFVGAHPMAGSEKTGWEHSSAELFAERTCFVTPLAVTAPATTARVVEFWRALGAVVTIVAPDRHDEIVAQISHLPQVLASTLCSFLAEGHPGWNAFAGGGLRDTTRIAAGDPQLWRAILEQNRAPVLAALAGYQGELEAFRQALAAGDFAAVTARLEQGRAYRNSFPARP
jgi:prephenate dehydrogenase